MSEGPGSVWDVFSMLCGAFALFYLVAPSLGSTMAVVERYIRGGIEQEVECLSV